MKQLRLPWYEDDFIIHRDNYYNVVSGDGKIKRHYISKVLRSGPDEVRYKRKMSVKSLQKANSEKSTKRKVK